MSKSAADRIIDHLGSALALQQHKRFPKDTVLLVDGTPVPTRDHRVAEQSMNYRCSTNRQVVMDADVRLAVAVGRPLPGNRNPCKAWELSGAKRAVDRTTVVTDGGHRGTGLATPHRRSPLRQAITPVRWHDDTVVHIALFHSVLGLRSAELLAAERLRRAGHEVVTPDLFGGETAATLDEGFQLVDRVGWAAVIDRARQTLMGVPDETVLAGVSMGAGVVADLWPERPVAAGVLLLHATAGLPASARPGLRVQLHAAEPDDFAPPERVAALRQAARERRVDLEVFRYPGVGHFYTDRELPDHDPVAAELTWRRVLEFLD